MKEKRPKNLNIFLVADASENICHIAEKVPGSFRCNVFFNGLDRLLSEFLDDMNNAYAFLAVFGMTDDIQQFCDDKIVAESGKNFKSVRCFVFLVDVDFLKQEMNVVFRGTIFKNL